MERTIHQMLSRYEQRRVSRREFVQALAALAAIPAAVYPETNTSVFQGVNLNHVTLSVSNVQRSRDFYQNLLGFPVLKQDTKGCSLAVGDRFMSLYRYDKPGYIDHFCIGINGFSLERVKATLQDQGLNPTIEFGTQVYFHDPDGNRVQLSVPDYKG
jgi:catechol 2,3-dioxygenase-like lactoylglutathione lyase family enzyme